MRKGILTMNEEERYEVIKKLIDTNGNKKNAALKLSYSERHINKMIAGYIRDGKSFFIHGNRGRTPAHALTGETKQTVLDLYQTKYFDTNFTHCTELLEKYEEISISVSTLNSIIEKEYILSPKATRPKKRKTKLMLKHLKTQSKFKKVQAALQSKMHTPNALDVLILAKCLKWMLRIHLWFGDAKTQLHVAVDDATGAIVGAYFDEQETLKGYYNVFHQVLTEYGIPYLFFTDNRTVFEYK